MILAAGPSTLRVGIGVGTLVALAVAVLTVAAVPLRTAVATATLRAAAQLALVGLVVAALLSHPAAAGAGLAFMFCVSVATSARRLGVPGAYRDVAIATLAGLLPVLAVAFAVPMVPRTSRYLVAVGGIVLGNTMVACTLTGRRFFAGLHDHREEIEGWLAIGATPRQACAPTVRRAIREAMLPSLDTTRTVGLVTLPGAFVGSLAGGAGVGAAARFQLVVLIGIVAAQACAGTALGRMIGAPTTLPQEEEFGISSRGH